MAKPFSVEYFEKAIPDSLNNNKSKELVKQPVKHKPLSLKHKKFIDEYFVDFNAARALIRSGFRAKNSHVASCDGAKLLARASIKAEVQRRLAETGIPIPFLLQQLLYTINADKTPEVREPEDWQDEGFNNYQQSKQKALDMLAKVQGAYKNKMELSGKDGEPLPPIINIVLNKETKE